MSSLDKLAVLIVTPEEKKRQLLETAIKHHVSLPTTVYTAQDGAEGQAKLWNVPCQLVITDFHLAKIKGRKLIDDILADRSPKACAILILDHPPEEEIYLDELTTGRVQFVSDWTDEDEVSRRVVRALNFVAHGEKSVFHLRFLAEGDQLIREGERADFVYILKKGQLRAYRDVDGKRVDLGDINAGEFVGEMAYIHGEPRSANVEALTSCELVEIPLGTLDRLLYLRPSWSKRLLQTLSRRLKEANDLKTSKS